MKLLLSTYACAPNHGSEHAVGWNWATEAHRQGHRVWALVAPAHRESIAAACRADPTLAGIVWVFPEVPLWPLRQGIEPKRERTYNLLWQLSALRHASRLQREVGFDLIHHLTWGGVRAPTFLGSLGAPLLVGPIGGGETSPPGLRDTFHRKARLTEWLRDLSNATITVNPMVRKGLSDAAAIFVKTPETRRLLTPTMQAKSLPFIELTLHPAQIGQPRRPQQSAPKLLFAGRLLYWKGAHVVLRTFASVLSQIPDARLTVVGKGPERNRLKALAASLQIAHAVEFISWVPQPTLFELYASHDLFVFPSLHDSSGNVVAEALARGMPVVCLDLGGPRQIVTPESGIVVGTAGLTTAQVAVAMAREIVDLLADAPRMSALSAGAVARARDFLLSARVAAFYETAANFVAASARHTRAPRRTASHVSHAIPPT